MYRKTLAAILTAAMTVTLLAGCGNSQPQDSGVGTQEQTKVSEESSQSRQSESRTQEEQPENDGDEFVQTWPDGQKIRWFVRGSNTTSPYSRFNDLKAIPIIEEKFHVDIEFVIANGSNDEIDAQYLAMLTSGDVPDVVCYLHNEAYQGKGGIPGLYSGGVCMELNDLIENNMPNLKKIFETYPDVARDMRTDDGKYLYFQRINPLESDTDKMSLSDVGLVMRQDWLDNVGMQAPETIDEWYNVLKAFKDMDPNGNGIADEIPFDAASSGLTLFEGAFGISKGAYIDPKTGKVNYGAVTQEYKSFLEEMNKWYSEGLMANAYDEEGNLAKSDTLDENIAGDIAGSWKGLASAAEHKIPLIAEKNPNAALAAVPYPKTKDGEIYIINRNFSRVQRETQIISADCEYPEAVAAIIDYMYSDEGSELMLWGEEGVTFEREADGTRKLTEFGIANTELPDGSKPQNYKMYGNQCTGFPAFGLYDINMASREDWYREACRTWCQGDYSINYPKAVSFTEEEQKILNPENSEIDSYIEEMQWKFITGQEPLSNFDTYLANLERMGIKDRIQVYQDAYDRYLAR